LPLVVSSPCIAVTLAKVGTLQLAGVTGNTKKGVVLYFGTWRRISARHMLPFGALRAGSEGWRRIKSMQSGRILLFTQD
jgi:hypothetical protein